MTPLWDPLDLSTEAIDRFEDMGTKEKHWVHLDATDEWWLVKLTRRREDGRVLGEDWAEWLTHHLASAIGVPSAAVRPTTWGEARAIASLRVTSPPDELVHGNSLLVGRVPGYDPTVPRHNPLYTPDNVRVALSDVAPPQEFTGPIELTGFDVWAGYLVLDAWVAGRDRHHENWGVIRRGDGRWLAPSFDHGNALGFAETEEKVAELSGNPSKLGTWVSRGASHHFAGKPTLVNLALAALSISAPCAGTYWMEQLEAVTPQTIDDLVAAVPPQLMSDARRTFIAQLLAANQRRLLDDYRAQVAR